MNDPIINALIVWFGFIYLLFIAGRVFAGLRRIAKDRSIVAFEVARIVQAIVAAPLLIVVGVAFVLALMMLTAVLTPTNSYIVTITAAFGLGMLVARHLVAVLGVWTRVPLDRILRWFAQAPRVSRAGNTSNLSRTGDGGYVLFLRPWETDLWMMCVENPAYFKHADGSVELNDFAFLGPDHYSLNEVLFRTSTLQGFGFRSVGGIAWAVTGPRILVDDVRWQELAAALMQQAHAVLIIPSTNPGTAWELQYLIHNRLLDKALLLVPPEHWIYPTKLFRRKRVVEKEKAKLIGALHNSKLLPQAVGSVEPGVYRARQTSTTLGLTRVAPLALSEADNETAFTLSELNFYSVGLAPIRGVDLPVSNLVD